MIHKAERRNIKLILSFIVFILFGQFIFSKVVAEPYPSIVFPGFAKVVKSDTLFYGDKVIFCFGPKGDSTQVSLGVLLGDVPDQFNANVLNTIIKRENPYVRSKEVQLGIFTYELQQKLIFNEEERGEFRDWLTNNVQPVLGTKSISYIKIYNYEYKFDLGKGEEIPGKKIINVDTVDFRGN